MTARIEAYIDYLKKAKLVCVKNRFDLIRAVAGVK